jgi:hypothetical protein
MVTVRDVTAICPAPVVRIDRSFAVEPPRCVSELTGVAFKFDPDSKWIAALADGTGEIKAQGECLGVVADWIEAERAARMTMTELTQ